MKKTIYTILLFSITFVSLTGCNRGNAKLRKLIDQLNNECPIPLGTMGSMTGAEYTGHTVYFHYNIVNQLDLDRISENYDQLQMHDLLLESYESNTEESFVRIMEALVEAKVNLNVVFHKVDEMDDPSRNSFFRQSHHEETLSVVFTWEELSYHMPHYNQDANRALESLLHTTELQLPLSMGDGVVCNRVSLDDEYFTYILDCDENKISINEMQMSITENYDAMLEMILTSEDPTMINLIELLSSTGHSLRYLYVGHHSGKEAAFIIDNRTLTDYYNK